jgi:hypothetical protein
MKNVQILYKKILSPLSRGFRGSEEQCIFNHSSLNPLNPPYKGEMYISFIQKNMCAINIQIFLSQHTMACPVGMHTLSFLLFNYSFLFVYCNS